MKSRQINFFLTTADQADLINSLDPLGEFVYVRNVSRDGTPEILESASIATATNESLQIYIAQLREIKNIVFQRLPNVTFSSIDVVRSPVVQFVRCYQDERCIRRGRLYFVTAYYDRRQQIEIDEVFLSWARKIVARARRVLKKEDGSLIYYGKQALHLKQAGITMDLGF